MIIQARDYILLQFAPKTGRIHSERFPKEEMILDEIGNTAEMMLEEVSKHFGHTMVAEHVVMPNHVHLILVLKDIRKFVGDGEMMVDGIRLDVGPCHGMALRATDDGS